MRMNFENNFGAMQSNNSCTITTLGQHIATIAFAIAIDTQISIEDLCAQTMYRAHNRIGTATYRHFLLSFDFYLHAHIHRESTGKKTARTYDNADRTIRILTFGQRR